jgi:hypothetical protein
VTELTQPFQEPHGSWRRFCDLVLAREEAPPATPDESVSFAELVWAHAERQKEVLAGVRDGPWEQEYRRRLGIFKVEHGTITEAYWCRYEASGAAMTEKRGRRRPTRLSRRQTIMRLHTATDWRTANAPSVALCLHRWETIGIKASEILRETSELIALNWIFAASARLLGVVDRDHEVSALDTVLAEQATEQEELKRYYVRAAENSGRIVYFKGMLLGTGALAAFVGFAFLLSWALGWLDPGDEETYTLFVVIAMGAVGATLSVMTRMAKENGFAVDFEVGRKSVRFLGGLRPWIGALFALAVYLAVKAGLLDFVTDAAHTVYFYATIAFLAGFSERRAKVLLDSVGGGGSESAPADTQKAPGTT